MTLTATTAGRPSSSAARSSLPRSTFRTAAFSSCDRKRDCNGLTMARDFRSRSRVQFSPLPLVHFALDYTAIARSFLAADAAQSQLLVTEPCHFDFFVRRTCQWNRKKVGPTLFIYGCTVCHLSIDTAKRMGRVK